MTSAILSFIIIGWHDATHGEWLLKPFGSTLLASLVAGFKAIFSFMSAKAAHYPVNTIFLFGGIILSLILGRIKKVAGAVGGLLGKPPAGGQPAPGAAPPRPGKPIVKKTFLGGIANALDLIFLATTKDEWLEKRSKQLGDDVALWKEWLKQADYAMLIDNELEKKRNEAAAVYSEEDIESAQKAREKAAKRIAEGKNIAIKDAKRVVDTAAKYYNIMSRRLPPLEPFTFKEAEVRRKAEQESKQDEQEFNRG